ncbi:hypothetical protein AURDEDRAFT_76690 [Auricularia subglabra TFB-10046 SS5]|uniref:CxC2-like cysteine cluster KDZ transposase-associated domain-containing protein n=1 Tax=Auricularia subglabra (strain TFB-10046 / SS5) TaxID=717982 RepID=J0WPK2_AURST|nr:hypothetical protein AURDEDRAFT_76690 [Auricularia subglabra TFB-10046 SS5]
MYLQPASVFMAEFQERRSNILDCLLRSEYDPRCLEACACDPRKTRAYRCRDCMVFEPCCQDCLKATHAHLPFHRLEEWTGSCFTRCSLYSLGFELCLGHNGSRCPMAAPQRSAPLVVVHTNGIHRVRICYCECSRRPSYPIQLLRASLYPATWTLPATAFTFHVLKHYHLDSLQSRKPAYDYWAILRRLTDNTRVNPVPDRYEELLRVSREWRVLMLFKRSGQFLGISEFLPDKSTSVAVFCPSCPRPGINLREGWEEQVTERNRYFFLADLLRMLTLLVQARVHGLSRC